MDTPKWRSSYTTIKTTIGLVHITVTWEPRGYKVSVSGYGSVKLKNLIKDRDEAMRAGLALAKRYLEQTLSGVEALSAVETFEIIEGSARD